MHAQRRPGAYPRRHPSARPGKPALCRDAQRRPGAYPRRHVPAADPVRHPMDGRSTKAGSLSPATPAEGTSVPRRTAGAQRRPGAYPRRHTILIAHRAPRMFPLNEGRELIPGDTGARGRDRIPGRARSTKAGSLSPATPEKVTFRVALVDDAQRRPGAYPRRHNRAAALGPSTVPRSTKAGSLSPATPPRPLDAALPLLGRSTKAGSLSPATRGSCGGVVSAGAALNEGRELIPGDTGTLRDQLLENLGRSTKAGSLSPATHRGRRAEESQVAQRSTKAGSLSPATQARGRWRGADAARSTKAGSLSPATRRSPRRT